MSRRSLCVCSGIIRTRWGDCCAWRGWRA